MSSWDRFSETSVPNIESFYSNLNMSGVSDSDYEHAQSVGREVGIKDMGEYHDLYLCTDTIFQQTYLNHLGEFVQIIMD